MSKTTSHIHNIEVNHILISDDVYVMNIAIFTNNYLPNPYGVSTSVEGFRQSLIARGHTVYIFAPRWFDDITNVDKKNIFRYPAIKVPTKVDFSLVVPYSAHIDEQIEQMDFDIIHAQHPNLLGATAQKWARKKKVPLVFTWHSLYDRYAHYMPFVPEKISAHLAMNNATEFANTCDHVIVPTQSIVPIIVQAGVNHDRISVVPSGVDEKLFANSQGKKIRKKYHITDDQIVLTTVSRLTEEKNVIFLAKHIAHVLYKNPHVVFLCAGEGDLQGKMQDIFVQKNVMHQVFFAGKVARDVVKDYLAAGDIFVYASTSETQGTIVTENMYIGRPIVGVNQNGVGSLIDHHVNGCATQENNTFAQHVQDLIDDKDVRERYGESAYITAHKKYTTDACTQKLLDVYAQTMTYYDKTR